MSFDEVYEVLVHAVGDFSVVWGVMALDKCGVYEGLYDVVNVVNLRRCEGVFVRSDVQDEFIPGVPLGSAFEEEVADVEGYLLVGDHRENPLSI